MCKSSLSPLTLLFKSFSINFINGPSTISNDLSIITMTSDKTGSDVCQHAFLLVVYQFSFFFFFGVTFEQFTDKKNSESNRV